MQITVTFENLEEFQKYFGQPMPAAAAPAKLKAKPKAEAPASAPAETPAPVEAPAEEAKQEAPKTEAPVPQEKITKTDVRAVALKLSKAGKSKELKAIFSEFGAEKLSEIKEEDYPALMAKLGEVDA